ncbi:unnamed protein product, partial [Polarella glacialis]
AEEVEGPFLKGIEILSPALALETIALCEAAAASTQKALEKARLFFAESCKEAASFKCEDPALRLSVQSLTKLSARVHTVAQKLRQYCKDMEGRKRLKGNS